MKTEELQKEFDVAYENFMKFWQKRRDKLVQQAQRRPKDRGLTRREGKGQPQARGFKAKQIRQQAEEARAGHLKSQQKSARQAMAAKKKMDAAVKTARRYEAGVTAIRQRIVGQATAAQVKPDQKRLLQLSNQVNALQQQAFNLGFKGNKINLSKIPQVLKPRRSIASTIPSQGVVVGRGVTSDIVKMRLADKRLANTLKREKELLKAMDDQKMYEVERGKQIFVSIMNTVESLYQSKKFDQADKHFRDALEVLTAMQSWMPVVPKIPSLAEYSDSSTKLKLQP